MMAVDGVIRVVVIMAFPLVALAWDYNFAESITSWLMPTGVNDGKSQSDQSSFLTDNPTPIGVGVGSVLGAVGLVAAAPAVIPATGLTSAGIAAGTVAAKLMSATAVANGNGVAVGSLLAIGKSIGKSDQSSFLTDNPTPIGVGVGAVLGAVGLVAAAPSVIPATGLTSAGIAAGSVAAKLMSATAVANGGGVAVGSLVAIGKSIGKSDQSSFLTDNLTLGVGAVLGAVGLVAAAPAVIAATGFTSAGIAAGSVAAKLMSATAIANGGGVAVGSLVAIGQSIGAAGLGATGTAVVAVMGSTAGAVAGWAASYFC